MSGVVSSAVTSTRIGSLSACSASSASASSGAAARPPGTSASGFPVSLPAASAATRRRADSPLGSNDEPAAIDGRHQAQPVPRAGASSRAFAMISASARPIWPKPSSTTSVWRRASAAPPPIFESWKAPCTAPLRGRGVLGRDDERDVELRRALRDGDDVDRASASAAKTRAAMPRWPAMPMPTTATVASPVRSSTPSISWRAIWSRNSSVRRSRARSRGGLGDARSRSTARTTTAR